MGGKMFFGRGSSTQHATYHLLCGSDPIHRDVFKKYYIIRAKRVKKLRFFRKKRERKRTHIASCSCFWVLQTGLALQDNARLHHDCLR